MRTFNVQLLLLSQIVLAQHLTVLGSSALSPTGRRDFSSSLDLKFRRSLKMKMLTTAFCSATYKNDKNCPLKCWPENRPPCLDTQQHVLLCNKLKLEYNNEVAIGDIKYDDIYG